MACEGEHDPLAYATPCEYLEALKLEDTLITDERLEGLRASLLASSRWIDRQCEGQFAIDPHIVTRHFGLRNQDRSSSLYSNTLKLPPFTCGVYRRVNGVYMKPDHTELVHATSEGVPLYDGIYNGNWAKSDSLGRVIEEGEYIRADGTRIAVPMDGKVPLAEYEEVDIPYLFEYPFEIRLRRDSLDSDASTRILPNSFTFAPVKSPYMIEPEPYTSVVLDDISSSWRGLGGPFIIEVDAKWGWPAVPEPIKKACIHYTSIERLEGARGVGEDTPYGSSLDVSKTAMWIVRSYLSAYKTNRRQPPFVWKQPEEEVAIEFNIYNEFDVGQVLNGRFSIGLASNDRGIRA